MKKIIVILMIVILIIIITSIVLINTILNSQMQGPSIIEEEVKITKWEIVKNYNEFFTVVSCVNRYVSYLTLDSFNVETIYNLLDIDYRQKQSVTKEAITEKIEIYDEIQSFSAREMYKNEELEGFTKYYVYGVTKDSLPDGVGESKPIYLGIKLDKNNMTFSVIPCTQEEYNQIKQGE